MKRNKGIKGVLIKILRFFIGLIFNSSIKKRKVSDFRYPLE